MIASEILTPAARQLFDPSHVRWNLNELIGYLNEGQVQICKRALDGLVVVSTLALVQGVDQNCPADSLRLVEVVRNAPSGKAVRLIAEEDLSLYCPDWPGLTASNTVLHYLYEEQNPNRFQVYPPAGPASSVVLRYVPLPQPVVAVGDTISVGAVYAAPLLDWVLYRAFSKDADLGAMVERAQAHYAAFKEGVGERVEADTLSSPNSNKVGGRPRAGISG